MADQFSPFVEEEPDRLTTQPVSGGIDISDIEHITQGVSVNGLRQLAKGTIPRLGSVFENHITPNLNYGQSEKRNEIIPYVDKGQFMAVEFLQDESSTKQAGLSDGVQLDGSIEPLTIRTEAEFTSIENPFIARSFSAQLSSGNEDIKKASGQQQQFIPIRVPLITEAFEDSTEYFAAQEAGGLIMAPGFIFEPREIIHPFVEEEYIRLDQKLTNDSEINGVLLQMTGSAQDNLIPPNHKSSGAGITYFNTPNGTDSLAYGGLTKKHSDLVVSTPNGFTVGESEFS